MKYLLFSFLVVTTLKVHAYSYTPDTTKGFDDGYSATGAGSDANLDNFQNDPQNMELAFWRRTTGWGPCDTPGEITTGETINCVQNVFKCINGKWIVINYKRVCEGGTSGQRWCPAGYYAEVCR